MSWKGFTKAVARLPHTLASKTGYAETTRDAEFQELVDSFYLLETLTKKLYEDAKTFKDSLSAMLTHQQQVGQVLSEVYGPITGRSSTSDTNDPDDGMVGSPDSEQGRRVRQVAMAFLELREQLLPDLDTIERQVIAPTTDFLTMISNVKKVITKRAHKLIDYDRHRESVKKMKDRTDRDYKDEKKLGQYEASLDQATREYQNIHNLLMKELPTLLSLRISFADPCFRTLFWHQLKAYQALSLMFTKLDKTYFQSTLGISAKEIYLARETELLAMLADLTVVKRPFKTSDGTDIVSPTREEGMTVGTSSKSPPAYSEIDSSPIPRFNEMHKQFSPSPATSCPQISPAADTSSTSRQYVVALYDYTGETDGDLSFYRDDKIEIVEKTTSQNDWWTGRLRGKVGQFPGNYVAEL